MLIGFRSQCTFAELKPTIKSLTLHTIKTGTCAHRTARRRLKFRITRYLGVSAIRFTKADLSILVASQIGAAL